MIRETNFQHKCHLLYLLLPRGWRTSTWNGQGTEIQAWKLTKTTWVRESCPEENDRSWHNSGLAYLGYRSRKRGGGEKVLSKEPWHIKKISIPKWKLTPNAPRVWKTIPTRYSSRVQFGIPKTNHALRIFTKHFWSYLKCLKLRYLQTDEPGSRCENWVVKGTTGWRSLARCPDPSKGVGSPTIPTSEHLIWYKPGSSGCCKAWR